MSGDGEGTVTGDEHPNGHVLACGGEPGEGRDGGEEGGEEGGGGREERWRVRGGRRKEEGEEGEEQGEREEGRGKIEVEESRTFTLDHPSPHKPHPPPHKPHPHHTRPHLLLEESQAQELALGGGKTTLNFNYEYHCQGNHNQH